MEINIGDTFGRWTIIGDGIKRQNGHLYYPCQCSCEKHTLKSVDIHRILNHSSMSCGCLRTEMLKERFKKHGDTKTRLYHIWLGMKSRCNNPNNKRYSRYGGRGINVCCEWNNDFASFKKWAYENGFDEDKKNYSIDRIDNDKGYSPDNCRWATSREQCNNRSSNIIIEYNGEKKTATEWAIVFGVKSHTLIKRYKEGRPLEEVFSKNLKVLNITYNGETHTLPEWSKITGIKKTTLWARYDKGEPLERVFYKGSLPPKNKKEREVV